MKIVCVVPIFGRQLITIQTLKWLKSQSHPINNIIAVGTSAEDEQTAKIAGVEFLYYANNPLSNKVQAGVAYARKYNPDVLLMGGSDSWLTSNWCEVGLKYIKAGADLVGKTQGYICRVNNNEELFIISARYRRRTDPFGAGKLISKRALDIINWELFPPGFNEGLDGRSYKILTTLVPNFSVDIMNNHSDVFLVEVKSNSWATINPFDLVMRSSGEVIIENIISDYAQWLDGNFPGSVSELKKMVPHVIINNK